MTDPRESNDFQASIAMLMGQSVKYLASYLEDVLPSVFTDWWTDAVLSTLSYQQRHRVDQRGIKSLTSLDLAALLRVLDQNWYQISRELGLTSEDRHFVKEMQTIRNRWAHASSEGFPAEDMYRDMDTLQRFAGVIKADETFIQEIRTSKRSLLTQDTNIGPRDQDDDDSCESRGDSASASLEPGHIVSLKSNPSVRGAIVSVQKGEPEDRYDVFVDGDTQTFYASQIRAEDRQDQDRLFLQGEDFHAYLTALQIRYPGLSTLYSLNAARIDFIPYQFRPVLRFIRADRPRLLIADGVGVGKTVEAGLILRELQARRDVRSVLIICPRPLVTERKWQIEMKRFEERFTHLDSRTLRFCVDEMDMDGAWPEQYQKVIVPYSLFDETLLLGSVGDDKRKRRKGLLDLDPPPRFDLVIVDEAHHIRNQETYNHRAVRFFCDHAEAVLFLTATPIQIDSQDLLTLLNTLRPDLIIDQESFEHMAEPNPFINRAVSLARGQAGDWQLQVAAVLDEAVATSWGQAILRHNPEYNRIRSLLDDGCVPQEERIRLITELEGLHTFSGIINRTRRCDIGEFTIRRPETVAVEFTPSQKELHDMLLEVQAEIFSRLHGDENVKFMMTTIRRQAASCLFGLVPFLQSILNRHLDELSWDEADDTRQVPPGETVGPIEAKIKAVLEKAQALDPEDPKIDALRTIIRDKQSLPNNKIMVFSSFRHTLRYLHDHLKADGLRVGMVHGDTPDEDRISFRSRFELQRDSDDCIDVLLFSEIGCEGLDYQFCDCIVNYDLPWNPMRIEQRIGRIDRIGQKSESVAIFNLIIPGTVDADIYERCLIRIGVFNRALGGSEEILGEVTREIRNIAENLSLNDEERRRKFQQLADNKIRLIQENEELEQKQLELFGIRLPSEQANEEIEAASSIWLTPDSIRRLIALYLRKATGQEQEHVLGDKGDKLLRTLRLSQEARNRLLKDLRSIPRRSGSAYREWENWLKGGEPHLLITFESECALHHPEAVFITPIHPLVRQAAAAFDTRKRVTTVLKARTDEIPPGEYKFVIYQWQFHGIKQDLELRPIASSEAVTKHLPRLLETAEEAVLQVADMDECSEWEDLDSEHYRTWFDARARHRQRVQEIAEYRRESLATSHRARLSLLEEQLNEATNSKIQTMRRSQIEAAEADYARRIQDLDIAVERADVTAGPVAYGVIQIDGEHSDAK